MGRIAPLVLLVGCYSPSVVPGAPCTTSKDCPRELTCIAQQCQLPGTASDGSDDSPQIDASMVDGPLIDAQVDAPLDAFVLGPWGAPTPVPGVDQTGGEEDPSFTSDRLTIVFERGLDLFIGTRASVTAAFSVSPLTALNTGEDEGSPEINATGTTIYFTSDRVTAGNDDVYVSSLSGQVWSAPTLVAELSASSTGDVAISADGLTAIVAYGTLGRSTRATTASAWGTRAAITGITFGSNPAAPALNAAGDLYFHAGGTRDLFVARRNATGFDPPVPITELNTSGRDSAPFVSADDRHLMFARDGVIYESSR